MKTHRSWTTVACAPCALLPGLAALARATGDLQVGSTLRITYYRGDVRHTATYRLRERPPSLDARLSNRTAQQSESGAVSVGPH